MRTNCWGLTSTEPTSTETFHGLLVTGDRGGINYLCNAHPKCSDLANASKTTTTRKIDIKVVYVMGAGQCKAVCVYFATCAFNSCGEQSHKDIVHRINICWERLKQKTVQLTTWEPSSTSLFTELLGYHGQAVFSLVVQKPVNLIMLCLNRDFMLTSSCYHNFISDLGFFLKRKKVGCFHQ